MSQQNYKKTKQIRIRTEIHKFLKVLAAELEKPIGEVLEERLILPIPLPPTSETNESGSNE